MGPFAIVESSILSNKIFQRRFFFDLFIHVFWFLRMFLYCSQLDFCFYFIVSSETFRQLLYEWKKKVSFLCFITLYSTFPMLNLIFLRENRWTLLVHWWIHFGWNPSSLYHRCKPKKFKTKWLAHMNVLEMLNWF